MRLLRAITTSSAPAVTTDTILPLRCRSREGSFQDLEEDLGEAAKRFEKIVVPEGTYLICETERTQYPTECIEDVRRRAVSEWLPTSGYELGGRARNRCHALGLPAKAMRK